MTSDESAAGNGTLFRWRSTSITGFEICYCNGVRFDAAERFVFDAYTVTLVEAGHGSFIRNARRFDDVAPGSIALSAPGDVIAAHSLADGMTCRNLYLTPALLAELTETEAMPSIFRLDRHSTQPKSATTFRALEATTRTLEQITSPLERDTRVWWGMRNFVMGESRIAGDDERGERPIIRRARELLLDRLDENVALDELADVACLNRFHFLRAFHRETGLPPHRYQQLARVGRARALLASGVSTLQVAVNVGFSDQAHFTRVFKQHLGITPGAYRATFGRTQSHRKATF